MLWWFFFCFCFAENILLFIRYFQLHNTNTISVRQTYITEVLQKKNNLQMPS